VSDVAPEGATTDDELAEQAEVELAEQAEVELAEQAKQAEVEQAEQLSEGKPNAGRWPEPDDHPGCIGTGADPDDYTVAGWLGRTNTSPAAAAVEG
jgi:hypothetical protein